MTRRSLTGRRWIVREDPALAKVTHSPPSLLEALARSRGIDPAHRAPLPLASAATLPPDLPKAVERIRAALASAERIGIFGDYDCDGVTAVAQLLRFFRRRGTFPLVRLPHRQREGYGLKEESLRGFREQNTTLLLLVDTGIAAHRELALAREAGMDVIVIDHHHLPQELPGAHALVHPALAPEDHTPPAAAGLAFGVVSALEEGSWEGMEADLALAAVGTVADLVELKNGNRALVAAGIEAFGSLRDQEPLALLARQAGIAGLPTSRDIAFRIAPRLNAAGRMADPSIALRALLGDEASLLSLERLNEDRQAQTRAILQAVEHLPTDGPFLSLASPDYPAGILGLIAGKLTEAHGKPSMVAQIQGDLCVASLRSVHGFHITEALQSTQDLLTSYGGHALAAGCTFPAAAFPALTERLSRRAAELLTPEDLSPTLHIDGVLDTTHVTLPLCEAILALEPFGQGNPEPRFLLPGVRFSSLKRVGRDFAHIQGTISGIKAVGFRLGSHYERIPAQADVACRLSIDRWNGNARPQIMMDDIRETDPIHHRI